MIKRGLGKMANFRVIKNKKAYLRRRRIRRFFTLTTILAIFAYVAHITYTNRMNQLDKVRAELEAYEAQYAEVMLRQGFYENQVVRLNDEDYIAMLARERYFLSLPNEIIFRVINGSGDSSSVETADEYDEN